MDKRHFFAGLATAATPTLDLSQFALALESWNPDNTTGVWHDRVSSNAPTLQNGTDFQLTPNRQNGLASYRNATGGNTGSFMVPGTSNPAAEYTIFTVLRVETATPVYLRLLGDGAGGYLFLGLNDAGVGTFYQFDTRGPAVPAAGGELLMLTHELYTGNQARLWKNEAVHASGLPYTAQPELGGFFGNQSNGFELQGELFAHYIHVGRMSPAERARVWQYLRYTLAF